jgi:hypothetical protein
MARVSESESGELSVRASVTERVALAVIGAVGVMLLWSRLAVLSTSFWNDEAYTALNYVNRGPRGIFFGPYNPNNHVLFSVLSWGTTGIVGRFEAAYRVPSVIPALAAVAIVAWWAWRRLGPWVAVAVVVLATVSPVHMGLSPQARGYGLAFLAGAGMLVGAIRASDHGRVTDIAVFAGFALVGIWTLPTFALAFVAQAAVLLLLRRDLRRKTLVACGAVAAASLLFYAPLLGEIATRSRQAGPRLPWYGWVSAPFSHLARPSLAALLPNRLAVRPLVFAIFVALAALACRRLWRRQDRTLLVNLVAPVVATYLALVLARMAVFPRFGSFLLFHVLVLLALGALEVWHLARQHGALRALVAVAAAASVLVGCRHVGQYTQDQPIENFQQVGQVVRGTGINRIVTNSRRPAGLWFYLGRRRVETVQSPSALTALLCSTAPPLVFVDHLHPVYGGPEPDRTCLRRRGAARVHVNQPERGSIDIWVISHSRPGRA